jgi:hypothetical protein
MSAIDTLLNFFTSQGVFEFYLPFLLTFSIFYALLIKIKIFGDAKYSRTVAAIVALVAGLYIMKYTFLGSNISEFFMSFFAQTGIFLTLLMVLGMVLGALAIPIFLGNVDNQNSLLKNIFGEEGVKTASLVIFIIIVLVVIAMFSSNFIKIPGISRIPIPTFGLSGDDFAVIALIVVTIIIIVLVTRGDGG